MKDSGTAITLRSVGEEAVPSGTWLSVPTGRPRSRVHPKGLQRVD